MLCSLNVNPPSLSAYPPPLLHAQSAGLQTLTAPSPQILSLRSETLVPQHRMSPSPDAEAPRVSTPQRRAPRKKGRSAQRVADSANSDPQDGAELDGSTDDDLLNLLGGSKSTPSSNQTPGLLQVTKTDMEAAAKKGCAKNGARRKPVPRDESRGNDTPASSDPEQRDQARTRRNKKGAADSKVATDGDKGAAAPKPAASADTDRSATPNKRSGPQNKAPNEASSAAPYDRSLLSQSLPASFFAEAQKGGKDEQQWDTPTAGALPGSGQPLNWQQQQLQNEMTPSKSARTAGGRRPSKAPAKAGGHKRRSSLDGAPVSGIAAAMNVAAGTPAAAAATASDSPAKSPIPVSAFDSSIPFHTGYNVHRAPQTPLRASQRTTAVTAQDGVITLPVLGEYPRFNRANHNAIPVSSRTSPPSNNRGSPPNRASQLAKNYAGPTFHNSPAGSELPKPDLDEF